MQNRREFLATAGVAAAGLALGGAPLRASSTPQSALVFDAMGEIRDVYGPDLMAEILGSGLDAITVTVCDPKTYEGVAYNEAMRGIAAYDRYLGGNPEIFVRAMSVADIDRAREDGKLAVFYLLQNSTPFGRDLIEVDRFYDVGVRSAQITYNHQNWAGAGCKERTGAGLTYFGIELIERMNDLRMLVDLSHASMATMKDGIEASSVPVVVSHTACMSVFENVRNTTDENLRLLAEHGGVVGICQIRPFVADFRDGAFEQYLDHILHAIDVAGIEHVAIGSDRDHRVIEMSDEYIAELKAEEGPNFNEADWPLFMDELNGPRRMEVVWDGLERRGVTGDRLEKVMGGNMYRIYEEVIG